MPKNALEPKKCKNAKLGKTKVSILNSTIRILFLENYVLKIIKKNCKNKFFIKSSPSY